MTQQWNCYANSKIVKEPTEHGVLGGMDFAIKDVFDIEGETAGAGNPDWLRTHTPAKSNACVVERLLQNGATLRGTTITDELMYSINGENVHYGTPVNANAPGRIPGGSSSGSASAVAAGLVDFAIGTDTGGSVRVPSAYCGIFGIRPTHGAISTEGLIPLAPSFDTVGWLARDAATLLAVGQALLSADHKLLDNNDLSGSITATTTDETATSTEHGPLGRSGIKTATYDDSAKMAGMETGDKYSAPSARSTHGFTRLLLASDMWELATESTQAALNACLPVLQAMTDKFEAVQIADKGLDAWMSAFRNIQALEIWEQHGEWIARTKPRFGPGIAERFAWASTLRREEHESAFDLRNAIKARMDALLDAHTILVAPTVPACAPLLNQSGDEVEKSRTNTLKLSCAAGLAGLPQATLSIKGEMGLPVGLSFIAGRHQDLRLLQWVQEAAAKLAAVNKLNT